MNVIHKSVNGNCVKNVNFKSSTFEDISHLLNKGDISIDLIKSRQTDYDKWKIHNQECCVFFDKNDICAVTYQDTSSSNKKVFKNVHDAYSNMK